nr:hypothetical protein [Cellulosimicrobium sp. MM]
MPAAPIALAGSLVLAAGESSAALLATGRVLCGVALGLVMAVGTTWVKELSDAAARASGVPDGGSGARRAGLALTLGFLVGAGVAAVLAQWAPWPTHTAYLLHAALAVATGVWLLASGDARRARRRARAGCATTCACRRRHRRFLRVVVPVAPWVFGCAGSAYAVLPGLVSASAGSAHRVLRAHDRARPRCGVASRCSAASSTPGTARGRPSWRCPSSSSAWASGLRLGAARPPDGALAAMVLGAGYGLALVAGLSEVQRIATPDDLPA